jgi:hypothetical protein
MSLFLDDDERTRNFKDLLREYLRDPDPETVKLILPYRDILVKAGIEVLCQDIGEMCVQIYYRPQEFVKPAEFSKPEEVLKSPSEKFTGFGASWIKSLQELITSLGFESSEDRDMFINQLLELVKGSNQDFSELAALLFCTPLFYYSNHVKEELVTAFTDARGNGRRLAIAYAILKVKLDPEPFEREIFLRLPPEISPDYIRNEYSKLNKINPELKTAKVVVLDKLLSFFLMEIVILDIGFHGISWKHVWPDWMREKES